MCGGPVRHAIGADGSLDIKPIVVRSFSCALCPQPRSASTLSFELFTSRQTLGALNVYADAPEAFDEHSVEIGLVYATHAALVWECSRREESFQSALASRDLIGQAKEILMQQFDIDAVHAFEQLKRLSQESNTALVDIAHRVVKLRGMVLDP